MNLLLVVATSLAVILRSLLISKDELSTRPELVNPMNSFARLKEGIFLHYNASVDPYSGVIFHEMPFVLAGMKHLLELSPNDGAGIWIFLDLATAFVLGLLGKAVAEQVLKLERSMKSSYHKDAEEIVLTEEQAGKFEIAPQLVYLFNPYTLLSCAAKITTSIDNIILSLFLLCMVKRQCLLSCLFLALATYKSFYPIILLAPLCLTMAESTSKMKTLAVLKTILFFALSFGALIWGSYKLMNNSWTFLWGTHGFILSVPELTPNMGLFWYIFTEMFEHFRVFFVATFQLNLFIYVAPLSIRLRKHPFLLATTFIALIAVFKSYPSCGDVGFYLAILPMFTHLMPHTKQMFIVICMLIASTVLGPILYHLWIYNGSANANYFFAINLVFGAAQIFLITDLLFSNLKRDFFLFKGFKEWKRSQASDSKLKLILK